MTVPDTLKEYHEKRLAGEVEPAKPMTPHEKAKSNPKSLRFAINAFCFECNGFDRKAVTDCCAPECPLWSVRPWKKNQDEEQEE